MLTITGWEKRIEAHPDAAHLSRGQRQRLALKIAKRAERAQHIDMDQAVGAFRSKTCPSCGQDFSLSGSNPNFCLECGLELFSKCDCGTLNFAFFRHCSNCNRPVGGKDANPRGQQT